MSSVPAEFEFQARTRIVFGAGSVSRLGELTRETGASRVLLVTDPGIHAAGHVDRATRSLAAADLHVAVFEGVEENPTSTHVASGVELARAERVDALVGLGGGSSMDCAKGINFVLAGGGTMRDYWGVGKARGELLPMLAVPTTAGTGSEAQSFALITDPETHQKMACGDRRAACRVALLDPELTLSQPAAVTAATGIDAISHAVESFVTRRRQPFSMVFAREAWRTLAGSFPRVLDRPDDVGARGQMLLGASLSGLAIECSMLGAAHAAANPVTARYGTVHGSAVGLLLPAVIRHNAIAVEDDYEELVRLAGLEREGESASDCLAKFIAELVGLSGLRNRLADVGVTEDVIPELARSAAEQWTAQFNPREVGAADFEEIYRCAL